MTTYEVSTDEMFCEKEKAVCSFGVGGGESWSLNTCLSEYHSHNISLVSDILLMLI